MISLVLENIKEVLGLEDSVLGEIGAVHSVLNLVLAEEGSEGFWTDLSCQLGVVGSTELSKGSNSILLSHL